MKREQNSKNSEKFEQNSKGELHILLQPDNEEEDDQYSPLFLHLQHQSFTITCLFCKLSKFKILSKVVVHTKEATLNGDLTSKTLLQINGEFTEVDNTCSKTSLQIIFF